MFTDAEKDYIKGQRLCRIATVARDGQPDVAAVGFGFDGESIFFVTGHAQRKTLKHLNVLRGNPRVALVIDDLPSVDPWRPRMLKIHGHAEIVETDDGNVLPFDDRSQPLLKITPDRKWSFGIDADDVPMGER